MAPFLYSCLASKDAIKEEIEVEIPSPKIMIIKKMALAKETEAKAFFPKKPTIILSENPTHMTPN